MLDKLVIKMEPIVAKATPLRRGVKLDILSATGTAICLPPSSAWSCWACAEATPPRPSAETVVETEAPDLLHRHGAGLSPSWPTTPACPPPWPAAGRHRRAVPVLQPLPGLAGRVPDRLRTPRRTPCSAPLQATTAHQVGVSDTLLVAANTTGGVTGKMISPQSIAVACAAVGLVGKGIGPVPLHRQTQPAVRHHGRASSPRCRPMSSLDDPLII